MNLNLKNEYFKEKMGLLKEFLSTSETLMSCLNQEEDFTEILDKREALIGQIKTLEKNYPLPIKSLFDDHQKAEIDQLFQLILNMDKGSTKILEEKKDSLATSIKDNFKEQKLAGYTINPKGPLGSVLDYKK